MIFPFYFKSLNEIQSYAGLSHDLRNRSRRRATQACDWFVNTA